jgi:hypothetical protein
VHSKKKMKKKGYVPKNEERERERERKQKKR